MSISKKRLKELRAIKDSAIDTSDIPELDESFWKKAKVHVPKAKTAISIRLDPEVLDWFRSQGKQPSQCRQDDSTMTTDIRHLLASTEQKLLQLSRYLEGSGYLFPLPLDSLAQSRLD
jgi:uncharacterized protein (DUF4415 family)